MQNDDPKKSLFIQENEIPILSNQNKSQSFSFTLSPQAALASIVMLYELMPLEARKRPVNTFGIKAMHQAFASLRRRPL